MRYSIIYSDKVLKQLRKLSKSQATRIMNKIDTIVEDPHHYLESCEGYPYYHQRVGNFRIIHDLNDGDQVIQVLKIGPRSKVYDR
ncbi:type II toxin-antitoxin system RelE/ParE family toxin [uncultured Methanospirillum sp.]|uniref:type II toxin-antitoxin system RelE family toxin n=1 Tax=uncultured Methanospirillum sp. TaxID=262503 RepID=UPI003749675A